tara:strand:+ start:1471 stop:1989 length:519 start_codon:yes stop_codon:yes gene_type:complete
MNKQELQEAVKQLKNPDNAFEKVLRRLENTNPEVVREVWKSFGCDVSERFEKKTKGISPEIDKLREEKQTLKRKHALGIITNEEKERYEELKMQDFLHHQENPNDPAYSYQPKNKEEILSEERWMALRFAWLLEIYLEHGSNGILMAYKGTFTPPPNTTIDYKLSKTESLHS